MSVGSLPVLDTHSKLSHFATYQPPSTIVALLSRPSLEFMIDILDRVSGLLIVLSVCWKCREVSSFVAVSRLATCNLATDAVCHFLGTPWPSESCTQS